jgi:hypothetical protein
MEKSKAEIEKIIVDFLHEHSENYLTLFPWEKNL